MKPALPFVVINLICAIAATASAQNAAPLYVKALASLPTTPADMEVYKNWESAKIDTATLDLVRRCQETRKLLHQASISPNCDWGWDYKKGPELMLPELKTARPLSQAAALWIRASFEQKREAEGVEGVQDLLLMGHRLTTPPLAITGSIGRALELQATDVAATYLPNLSQPSLQKLQSFMDALPADTPLSQALQKEQAVVIDLLADAAMTGGHKSFAADMPKQPAEAGRAISVSRELANEAVRIASLPPDQATAAGVAYKTKVAGASTVCQKTAIGEPENFAMMEARHRVNMALFKAALSVVRNGPAAVKTTSDPAASGPFGYRKTPGGFELTSKLVDHGDAVSLQVGPETQTQTAAAKSHHSATIKATVGVPNGWTIDDPTDFPAGMKGLTITSPPREQLTPSMAVISADVQKPDITMDELAKSVLPPKGMPGVENYVVESNQRTTIDGRTAYRCITTGTIQGVAIRWITTATVKKGILYVLTYTTLKSGPGANDPQLKAILAGFKID